MRFLAWSNFVINRKVLSRGIRLLKLLEVSLGVAENEASGGGLIVLFSICHPYFLM